MKIIDPQTNKNKYEIGYVTICGKDSNQDNFKIHSEEFGELTKGMPIYNCQVSSEKGTENYNKAIRDFKPDIVLSNVDPWHIDSISLSIYRNSYYWVNYSTAETPFYPDNVMFPTSAVPVVRKSMKETLSNADLIIPVTSIGYEAFAINMGLQNVSKEHVYNGLDFNLACTDNALTKSTVFGKDVSNDSFVFMTLGTNSERKKLDVVIEAFAKFLDKMVDKKKYKLYLHTNLDERIGGSDIVTQVLSLGLRDNVFAPVTFRENKMMTKKDLYKRYMVSDCYIGLPSGEGMGYGFIEAMMHKKPIIYHNYGGPSCYLKDVGLPVKTKETFAARNIYMKWGLADTDDAAKQMCRVVSDKKLRDSLGEKSFEKSKEFDWDLIVKKLESQVTNGFNSFNRSVLLDFNMRKII